MFLKTNKKNILSLILFIGASVLIGCNNTTSEGFDNKVFDVSKNSDNSLKATIKYITDNSDGKYYSLTLSGNGESKDYKTSNIPWKSISKKIKEVNIEEGVTKLGTYIFSSISITSIVLPSTLKYVDSTSFDTSSKVYIKNGSCETNDYDVNYYFYSESAPSDKTKKYWHYVNNNPVIWSKMKALFIGNSFTFYNNIPQLTEEIIKSMGYDFTSDSVTCGSYTLTKYADQNDEYGKQVYSKLTSNSDYDYVILQDQSTRSYSNYYGFYSAVESLSNLVKKTQKHSEVRLYATWGYPEGSSSTSSTVLQMEEKIREKYIECATSLSLKVHHVGKAFSKVYSENRDKINIYFTDNKHPSHYGSFLSAHVHAMNILGIDTRSSTFNSYYSNEEGSTWTIDDDNAKILKDAAYTVSF